MKEKLYTIPVNDAFAKDCECPLCAMYKELENDAIEYTMGPSYMEDDIREETDKIGFCKKHVPLLYKNQNRLGLALMLKTHMDKTVADIENLANGYKVKNSLLKKTITDNPVGEYITALNKSCFVCDRVNNTFERYVHTIIYLYKTDNSFKETFKNCKGFCTEHFENMYTMALTELSGAVRDEFINDIKNLYVNNMKRVIEDLDWFINKFDYRYANEPWKNSKDALIRTIQKNNSTEVD